MDNIARIGISEVPLTFKLIQKQRSATNNNKIINLLKCFKKRTIDEIYLKPNEANFLNHQKPKINATKTFWK